MTVQQVTDWLNDLGLDRYAEAFRANDIDGAVLRRLGDADLQALGVASLGHRKTLLAAIDSLHPPDRPLKEHADEDAWIEAAARALAAHWQGCAPPGRIIAHWPAPIAHEVWMLHALLAAGDPIGAFYQLRDTVEVLIKLPAAILARDLIESLPGLPIRSEHDTPAADLIRRTLLADSPSTGTWCGLAQTLARAIQTALPESRARLTTPGVAALFYTPAASPSAKPKETDLSQALSNLVAWRNRDIGHGGYRPDPAEHLDCLSRLLLGRDRPGGRHSNCAPIGLARVLARAAESDPDPWQGLALHIAHCPPDAPPRETPLIGAAALHPAHRGDWHEASDAPLLLVAADGRRLDLGPYAAARRCDQCDHQDVFLYNGHQGSRGTDPARRRYLFLEYRAAHPLERRWYQAPDLVAECERLPHDAGVGAGGPSADPAAETAIDFDRRDLVALLDDIALARRFIPPEYLNGALRAFIAGHDRGILWLTAPAHVGKTAFVVGLGAGLDWQGADHPLGPARTDRPRGVPVASFLIRREYRYGPQVFADDLRLSLAAALNLAGTDARQAGLPALDRSAPDRAGAFVDWLAAFRARAAYSAGLGPADPLLICLDGLDELPEPGSAPAAGGGSILDYLPAPGRLPAGTYLLLTSRALKDRDEDQDAACPAWVWGRVAPLLAGDRAAHLDIGLAHPGYRDLLRDYLRRELAGPLVAALERDFRDWDGGRAGSQRGSDRGADAAAAKALLALRDTRGEPIGRRLRQTWHLARPERPKDEDPPAALLAGRWRGLDGLFETLYAKADQRFLYLAMLADRLVERDLDLDALPELAAGKQLHRDWLERGLARLPPKLADLARRVLLLLAAAERVHDRYRTLDPPPVEAQFHGLPLDLLLGLVQGTERGERAGAGPAPARQPLPTLVYALYCLKPVLGSWKGEAAAHSRFRIGLKELTAAMADHPDWSAALARTHRRLAGDCAALIEDPSVAAGDGTGLGAADRYLLFAALGHATLAGEGMEERLGRNPRLLGLLRGEDRADDEHAVLSAHQAGIRWRTLALAWQGGAAAPGEPEGEVAQAADLFARGWHRHYTQDLTGALADYGAAIALMEGLRTRLGAEWPPTWGQSLAHAYTTRCVARYSGNDLTGALADYGTAIELMEELRIRLGAECPPAWGNNLAVAYLNRGVARSAGNDLTGALADYGTAIELMEELRIRLGAEWPPAWGNDLAMAYMNRGLARSDGNDLTGALADLDTAIELMEELRIRLGAEWPPARGNDLAVAYMNRGNARHAGNDLAGALADHGTAIDLMDGLRTRLGVEWPPAWGNELAAAYMSRGVARYNGYDRTGALADFGAAIDLREGLRARLGADWPPAWGNDLAKAYMNRGNARSDGNDLTGALADYGTAIALMEGLRTRLGGEWPPAWGNDLAMAYMNRGLARSVGNDLTGTLADLDTAIALQGQVRDLVRERYGESGWPVSWRVGLAQTFCARALTLGDGDSGRADLAAARAIADGLDALGQLDAAGQVRGRCAWVEGEGQWSG